MTRRGLRPPAAEHLERVQEAAQRVTEARERLRAALEHRRLMLEAARDGGVSLAALGRELGVSRQRVARMIAGK